MARARVYTEEARAKARINALKAQAAFQAKNGPRRIFVLGFIAAMEAVDAGKCPFLAPEERVEWLSGHAEGVAYKNSPPEEMQGNCEAGAWRKRAGDSMARRKSLQQFMREARKERERNGEG